MASAHFGNHDEPEPRSPSPFSEPEPFPRRLSVDSQGSLDGLPVELSSLVPRRLSVDSQSSLDGLPAEFSRHIQSALGHLAQEEEKVEKVKGQLDTALFIRGLQDPWRMRLLCSPSQPLQLEALNALVDAKSSRLRAVEELQALEELIRSHVTLNRRLSNCSATDSEICGGLSSVPESSALYKNARKRMSLREARYAPNEEFMQMTETASMSTRAWLRQQFCQESDVVPGSPDEAHMVDMTSTMTMASMRSYRASGFRDDAELASPSLVNAGKFTFDSLSFSQEEQVQGSCLSALFTRLFQKDKLLSKLKRGGSIKSESHFGEILFRFLEKVETLYRPDAIYHGSAHAVDVTSTMYWFLRTPTMQDLITDIDVFMSLVAAAIHDVGHGGVNNLFLQKTLDPIAITYNDRSCLEQMHLAVAFELTQADPGCNWLGDLDSTELKMQQYVRKGIIGMVLATDMAKHAEYVSQLEEMASAGECGDDSKNFLLECVLHACDTSNPAKPRDSMLRWTRLVNLEFWSQGDQERRLGLEISPLCDREKGKQSLPQGQVGFIKFVVMPLFNNIVKILTDCDEAIDGLEETKKFWEKQQEQGITFDDIYPDG